MGLKLTNNAVSRLASSITSGSTTIYLFPGDGALFPSLSAGEYFPATLINSAGDLEIIKITARSADTLTVTRAQESTTARAFTADDRIEVRLTAGSVNGITGDVATAQGNITTAQGNITTLQGQMTTANSSITTLNSNMSAAQATISTHTTNIASLQSQIDALPAPEGLPVGFGPIPWSLPTEPTGWIFADGRTLTSGVYTSLRSAYIAASFPFGQDGSGNPKIPDMRGRVPGGKDNMGGTAASRLTTAGSGVDGATLGASGGAQTHTITDAQMPYHTHSGSTAAAGDHAHSYTSPSGSFNVGVGDTSYNVMPGGDTTGSAGSHSHSVSIGWAGGGVAHNNTQPTLITNYLIKV